ncbi:MAG TPA: SDR family oxidoreductase [Devosiaceae bacterium]
MTDHKGVALVTGASSGIGRAVALGLAAAGYRVAICARRQQALDAVAAESGASADRILARACDVTDEAEVAALFAAIAEKFGRMDLVFNNAGRASPAARIDETRLEDFRAVMEVNVTGVFLVAREAFRMMRAQKPQGGRIINNGSISAHIPRPDSVAYGASKHAVSGITRSIAIEGRPFDIACGQIDIGNTASDMTADMHKGMLQPDGSMRPEPTFDVKHVVDAILYMAGLPLDANVPFLTVMATKMPYLGRG